MGGTGAVSASASQSAEIRGVRIAYRRAGQGPPLVLLHGIGGNAGQWAHQLGGLAGEFTVVAWDAPGYGGSADPEGAWAMADYADHLAGLLDVLGLAGVHLLGQSWGGVLAQEFYRRHPERVASLLLVNTFGAGMQPEAERQASLEGRLRALETMTPAEMAARRAPLLVAPGTSAAVLAEVEAMLAEIHPAGYRVAAIALAEADARDVLPRVAVPVLVVAGDYDTVVPPAASEALRDAIPGAGFAVVAGTGHLSSQERPDAFNALVRDFLRPIAIPQAG